MPLPRVTAANDAAILARAGDPDFINEIFHQLDEKNPIIAKMIRERCEKYIVEGQDSVMPLSEAVALAALVYQQLASQVEAEEMKALLDL